MTHVRTADSTKRSQKAISSFFKPKGTPPATPQLTKSPPQKHRSKPQLPPGLETATTPSPPQAKKVRTGVAAGKKISQATPPGVTSRDAPGISGRTRTEDDERLSESGENRKRKSQQHSPAAASPITEEAALVGRPLRVYWPLDKTWYKGVVKSYDGPEGKHLIAYDEDGEEELLDLKKEKVGWLPMSTKKEPASVGVVVTKTKRRVVYVEDESEGEAEAQDDGGDSEDEDWGQQPEAQVEAEDDDFMVQDFEVEEDGDDVCDEEHRRDGGNKRLKLGGRRESSSDNEVRKSGVISPQSDISMAVKENEGVKETCHVGEAVLETPGTTPRHQSSVPVQISGGKKGKSADVKSLCSTSPGESPAAVGVASPSLVPQSGGEVRPQIRGEIAERFGTRNDKFPFLTKNRKDGAGKRPADAGYDCRTLHIPEQILKDLSGGQRQWWQFKAKHMDKVLLFKMGKFYEMFEMDAHIGAQELDLQYMKGDQPHCGFPEKNYAENAERLARKGYRVLVVEQVETPDQLEVRKRETGSKDRVVMRKVCAVLTKGTLVDAEMLMAAPHAAYLMSVSEVREEEEERVVVGVCAVDAAAGLFLVGQFVDDAARTRLRSILSELRPVELVKPAGALSEAAERALRDHTRQPLVNCLSPGNEFWDADKTVENLETYFRNFRNLSSLSNVREIPASSASESRFGSWPAVLRKLAEAGAAGGAALSAFGGALSYLKQMLLDESLLSLRRVEVLPGSDRLHTETEEVVESMDGGEKGGGEGEGREATWEEGEEVREAAMVLDSAAIENLELVENNQDGGQAGTLLSEVDHCATSFGKRLLRQWVVRPLLRPEAILERQEAILDLKGVGAESLGGARKVLSGAADMERLLARLHRSSGGGGGRGRDAQNVVLYEDAGLKHVKEFVAALEGCRAMAEAVHHFRPVADGLTSTRLQALVTPGKAFPDLRSHIQRFEAAFDWAQAQQTGRIVPSPGGNAGYDALTAAVAHVEGGLEAYLQKQRKLLGNPPEMTYVTVGKDPYQMEVPERLHPKVPRDFEVKSQRKGFRRYWTPAIVGFLEELSAAQEQREAALKTILSDLRAQFCRHLRLWSAAVRAIAELDALGSLAMASTFGDGAMCRPLIRPTSAPACLTACGLRHPIAGNSLAGGGSFVPNDTRLGGEGGARLMLLTGPNMGGKSTLLRQVCLAVIMAQMGADVPATSFAVSPMDRVFVRMGAQDHIMGGQSTFLVELAETATMLRSATSRSLVALDELGRGTSTSDGQAIAHAVLSHLAHRTQCLGMFSTHYHKLADEHGQDEAVSLRHMACKVGPGAHGAEEVTFLYKLAPGSCPKSYGINVARLAGMPESVLLRAETRAAELEREKEASSSDRCQQEGELRAGNVEDPDVGMNERVGVDEEHRAMRTVLTSLLRIDVTAGGCSKEGGLKEVWSQAKRLRDGERCGHKE